MSIEVLDGEFPARLWMEARGDSLVEVALQCQLIEWRWQHFGWGSVLEIVFDNEADWERFCATPAVQAALDAVPDRVSGLMIYRAGAALQRRENRGDHGLSPVPALPHWSSRTIGCSSPLLCRHPYCPFRDPSRSTRSGRAQRR
jgi:hypothetical protein